MNRRHGGLWAALTSIILPVLLGSMLILAAITLFSARSYFINLALDSLSETAQLVSATLAEEQFEKLSPADLEALCVRTAARSELRITIIDTSGQVIGDSSSDPTHLDLHLNRPEIRSALETGKGSAIRWSPTLKVDMAYAAWALKNPDGSTRAIVRISRKAEFVREAFISLLFPVVLTFTLIALSAALSLGLALRKITRPAKRLEAAAAAYASGDLAPRVGIEGPAEFQELARALNRMAGELSDRIRTISDQKSQAEALLNGMRESVIVLNRDLKIISMNPSAENLFTLDPSMKKSREGEALLSFCRSTDLLYLAKECLEKGESREARVPVYAPRRKDLIATATPIDQGLILVVNDITRLEKLEGLRRDFVANVSHELRTPITSIKGYLETLESGADDDRELRAKFLRTASRQTDRLESIIEDLLSLARIEQNEGIGLETEDIDLTELVRSTGDSFLPRLLEREQSIAYELAADIRIQANGNLIAEALSNLLDNACKYSKKGDRILVALARGTGGIRLSVTDNGMGIPAQEQERIFERFYRVDRSRSRESGGTGLGLSIVKHIAIAHGGHVEVQSEPGKGSTFTLIFAEEQSRPE